MPQHQADRARDEAERCQIWLDALEDALQVMDRKRSPGESPMARMERLTQDEGMPRSLLEVGALQTVLNYSRHQPAARQTAAVRRAYLALRQRMTRRQRLVMGLKRML